MIENIINKKGISPLIATVLLVGVVVALSLIVWFWYGQVIESQTDKANILARQACAQDVDFTIKNLCKDSVQQELRFKVENKGIPIPRFKLTFTGPEGSVAQDTSLGASTATTQDLAISYSSTPLTSIDSIIITPFIVAGEPTYCEDQQKLITPIQDC